MLPNRGGIVNAVNLPPANTCSAFTKNEILISNIRPYFKKIWFAEFDGGCSADILVLKVTNPKFDAKFVYYNLFQDLFFKHQMNGSKGSKMPRGDKDQIMTFLIPEFDKSYQKRIADFLTVIDDKIALNKKINTELENLAKTIYNYWFVQFDFPNEEGKPYKTSGGEMVWNEELKREIPKGWEVFLLKEKLEFERGVEPGSDKYFEKQIDETLIPFFKVGGMNGDTDVWIKKDDAKGAICCEEDILLSLDGSVGRIAIGLSGAYSSGIRKVYPKNGNFPKSYIYFLLHSDEIQQTIKKNATGSNILHAAKALDYMMAPYNANVVESFDKLCNPIFNKILATKKENQELIKLRDFLLPLLMNGQVNIKSEATEQLSMAAELQVKYGK
jgi:type I restriction enzyme S subunit